MHFFHASEDSSGDGYGSCDRTRNDINGIRSGSGNIVKNREPDDNERFLFVRCVAMAHCQFTNGFKYFSMGDKKKAYKIGNNSNDEGKLSDAYTIWINVNGCKNT